MFLNLKGRNEGDISNAGFEGEDQVWCSFYWIRRKTKCVDCFRFERSKCLDSGFVFENVFKCLRVFEFF